MAELIDKLTVSIERNEYFVDGIERITKTPAIISAWKILSIYHIIDGIFL